MTAFLQLRERTGALIGRAAAPIVAATTEARHARTFHPDGLVCTGRVVPADDSPFPALSERLAGDVLARFSAALWKGEPRWPDVLGIAVRFGYDQDLLFATIRSPFTMLAAPFFTDSRDFFANRYWAVSPFEVAGEGRLKFRISPPPSAGDRYRGLAAAVERGPSVWTLEARRVLHRGYRAVAHLELDRVEGDAPELRFDPFRSGRGIVPSGLVHSIRRAVYRRGQAARATGS